MHPYFLKRGSIMKAKVVYPGKPSSMHLEELPMPRVIDDQGFVLGDKVQVAEVFAKNGFLVLSSVAGGREDSRGGCGQDQPELRARRQSDG
jgi:hypothetical protein